MKWFWLLLIPLSAHAQIGVFSPGTFVPQSASSTPPTQDTPVQCTAPNTTNGTCTATFTTTTSSGDMIIVATVGISGGQDVSGCVDSGSTALTQDYSQSSNNIINNGGWVQFFRESTAAASLTGVTCTFTAGNGTVFATHVHKNGSIVGTLDQTSAVSVVQTSGAYYVSGGTIVGTSTQTCDVTFVGGGATVASTAVVALTSTNTIANGTAMTSITPGTNYTSQPTTATLSSGTAVCSGTATVSGATFIGGGTPWNSYPETTTQAIEYIPGVVLCKYNGANCVLSATGSFSKDLAASGGWTGSNGDAAYFGHFIPSTIQTNLEMTGTDSGTGAHYAAYVSYK